MKDLTKYMRQDDNYIEKLENACNEVIHSRYILADSKISALLQVIAGDRNLYGLFKEIIAGFDFAAELNKSKIPDGYDTYKIVLPRGKRKTAAYVFSLLYAFDTHAMSMKDFLHEFFYSSAGANTEYEHFVRQVVTPFKNCVLDIINGDEDEPIADDSFFERDDQELTGLAIEELVTDLREMADFIAASPSINAAEREELLLMCDGLYNTVYTKNKRLILILFVGYRNTVRVSKLDKELSGKVGLLEQKLRTYGIMV